MEKFEKQFDPFGRRIYKKDQKEPNAEEKKKKEEYFEGMKVSDDLTRGDIRALQELSDKGSNRYGSTFWDREDVRKFADIHNLKIKNIQKHEVNHPDRLVIAKEGTAEEVLRGIVLEINVPGINEKITSLYEKMKEMSVLDTIEFLDQYPRSKGSIEEPEVAVLQGLFFGYKPCDIEYYLRTRYFDEPKHKHEEDEEMMGELEKLGIEHVLCEKCTEAFFLNENNFPKDEEIEN